MRWISYHTKKVSEKYLFRFLSPQNLNRFLESGDLWFSRADKFGDKMECVLISDLEKDSPDFEKIERRKKRTLINCWHLADEESLAMWDTYSKNAEERRVFAIRFRRDDLTDLVASSPINLTHSEIKRRIYGKVSYKNLLSSAELTKKKVKFNAFRKESAFKYESEYRFVIQMNHEFRADGFNYAIGDSAKLPFKILINPLLPSGIYIKLKQKLLDGEHSEKIRESKLVKWLKPEQW